MLENAGCVDVEILSRATLSYEDLKPYPLYQLGVLDQLFAAIAPEWRDRLMGCVMVRAFKPVAG